MNLKPIASNMTEIVIGNLTVLFSYRTPVAMHTAGQTPQVTDKYWSATTSRHINKWLAAHGFSVTNKTAPKISQETLDALLSGVC